jgi:hypothetical protein
MHFCASLGKVSENNDAMLASVLGLAQATLPGRDGRWRVTLSNHLPQGTRA